MRQGHTENIIPIQKKTIPILACLLFFFLSCTPVFASSTAEDFLRLSGKLTPGISAEDAEALLGPSAETHSVGGDANLLRSSWLHGEMGVEIYFLKGTAYRVDLSRRFERSIDLLRTLDALTRGGQRQYGTLPRFDRGTKEYYWTGQGHRFSFSRHEPEAIRVRLSRE